MRSGDDRHHLDGVADAVLRIDCDDCLLQGSDACDDCVVTFLCDRSPGDAVTIDLAGRSSLEHAVVVFGTVLAAGSLSAATFMFRHQSFTYPNVKDGPVSGSGS